MVGIFNKIEYYERKLNLTQASRFLLPMYYRMNYSDLFFFSESFVNCYIGDAHHKELGQNIFLLFNYQMTVDYVKFERKIELMSEFNTDYDYGDERQTMYVLNIPKEHLQDLARFNEGRYTKFNPLLKSKILRFWEHKSEMEMLLKDILYGKKNTSLYWDKIGTHYNSITCEGESWPKPLLEKEIFYYPRLDNLKK